MSHAFPYLRVLNHVAVPFPSLTPAINFPPTADLSALKVSLLKHHSCRRENAVRFEAFAAGLHAGVDKFMVDQKWDMPLNGSQHNGPHRGWPYRRQRNCYTTNASSRTLHFNEAA